MASILLGGNGHAQIAAQSITLNRHGLIAGATGTGKTVSLQVLAEQLSRAGVPVFVPDIKGDLSGLGAAGKAHPKIQERVDYIGLQNHEFTPAPVVFWDLHGKKGHPTRTTVSEIGPLLLANLLELNETQTGVLYACFKEADNQGWLMLDLKDLNAMLNWIGDNANELRPVYGNMNASSIGAIRRRLLVLEEQGLDLFLGEPALDIHDLIQKDEHGHGRINLLEASTLIEQSPRLYATMMLWLLSELYEDLPEVGDLELPKLAIFIDEAHLLFKSASKPLLDKLEQVIRLIRSKGVGIFFITQNPLDIPEAIAGQLGLKIQHALRAFTAKDKKSIKAVAENFRENPNFTTVDVLPALGTGEALISYLDTKGIPQPVEKTVMAPPYSRIGPMTAKEIKTIVARSPHGNKFDTLIDRASAYEHLTQRAEEKLKSDTPAPKPTSTPQKKGRSRQSVGEAFLKSISRAIGSQLGRQIVRGIMGSLLKK